MCQSTNKQSHPQNFPPLLQPRAKSARGSFTRHLLIAGKSIRKKWHYFPKDKSRLLRFSQLFIHSSSEEWLIFRNNTNIAVAGVVKNVNFFQLCSTVMTFYTCLVLIYCRFKMIQQIPVHASTFPPGCHQSPLLITLLHQYLSVWSLRKFIFSTAGYHFPCF